MIVVAKFSRQTDNYETSDMFLEDSAECAFDVWQDGQCLLTKRLHSRRLGET